MGVWCQVGNVFITIHTAVPVGFSSLCSGDFLRRANGFAPQQVASSVALRALRSLVSDVAEDRLG